MNKNTILRHLAKNKFNVDESHIVSDDDTFTINSTDGRIFTQLDFSDAEIAQAENELLMLMAQAEAEILAKKAATIAKLEALGLDAEDIKALGL